MTTPNNATPAAQTAMPDYLKRIKGLSKTLPQPNQKKKSSFANIWFNWKEGENHLRFVGDFLQVRSHYLAPNAARKDRGLCIPDAFKGDDKLPANMNCPDWDIETETEKAEKVCVICKLHRIAEATLKNHRDTLSEEDNNMFFALKQQCSPRNKLKWNVIDRDNPYITTTIEGQQKQVLGYKVAEVGMEAWKDIEIIYNQLSINIADPEQGVDICVIRTNGARTSYSAQAMMDGLRVKQTPLTEAETALERHDLKKLCGKQVDQAKVLEALHLDLRSYIDQAEDGELPTAQAVVATPAPRAATPAPVAPKAPAVKVATAPAPIVRKAHTAPAAPVAAPAEEPSDIDEVQLADSYNMEEPNEEQQ